LSDTLLNRKENGIVINFKEGETERKRSSSVDSWAGQRWQNYNFEKVQWRGYLRYRTNVGKHCMYIEWPCQALDPFFKLL
jgi:hypothetical protein